MAEYPWEGLEIEEKIGSGSHGTVYSVLLDGKRYAMKHIAVPHDEEAAQALVKNLGSREAATEYCRDIASELLGEIKILRNFRESSHIVSIYDHRMVESEIGYNLFILMERMTPFPEYEITHPLGEKDAVHLGLDICAALEECEKNSVLHRDLKPDNILASEDGTFKLCDFGVARNLEKTNSSASIKGTFFYMAPEVYHGNRPDKRSDLYSLGLVLYRIMNRGREPFLSQDQRMIRYSDREQAMYRRMNGEALPPPVDASPEFFDILQKLCAWYPEKRYASAAELTRDLVKLERGTYRKKRQRLRGYGKRTAQYYRKIAAAVILLLTAAAAASGAALYSYREYFSNYCDPEIIQRLEEQYNFRSEARLNGHGVLYIYKNEDLYCTEPTKEYPWMNQKNRIQKIVFGEAVDIFKASEASIDEYLVENESILTIDNVAWTSPDTFRNCKNLEEIEIKSSFFSIYGEEPFLGDDSIERITCSPDAEIETGIWIENSFAGTPWIMEDGYRMIGSTLFCYNGAEEVLEDIPENTIRIADKAFAGNEKLKTVVLPSSVRIIGAEAFDGCGGLETIQLPGGLTQIGTCAFRECYKLDELTIPASVQNIGESVFRNCHQLFHLAVDPQSPYFVMDGGVLYDAEKTRLLWCTPGTSGILKIPETVKSIQDNALEECSLLSGIVIPKSADVLPMDLFGPCPALTSISLPDSNLTFCLENDILYSKDMLQLVFCLRNVSGKAEIHEGTQVIKEYAFSNCRDITEIVLPETVQYIFTGAFQDCTGLTRITLPASLKMIANDVFQGCDSLTDLYFGGTPESWKQLTHRFQTGLDEGKTTIHPLGAR